MTRRGFTKLLATVVALPSVVRPEFATQSLTWATLEEIYDALVKEAGKLVILDERRNPWMELV